MSKVYPVFATPLYEERIQEPLLSPLQEEMFRVYQGLCADGHFDQFPKKKGEYHSVSDTTFKKGTLQHKYNIDIIEEVVHLNAITYLELIRAPLPMIEALRNETYELNTWMTKTLKGKHAIEHSHGDADISGVYYVQTNNHDGNIYFRTPVRAGEGDNRCYQHLTHCNLSITPEVGKLMMFPGWLRHGVRENTTDSERVSFSFNIKLELSGERDRDINLVDYARISNRLESK
jgi:hypothetical protein